MKTSRKAPLSATDKLVLKKASADLVTVHRDALKAAAELIEDGLRQQYGWHYKVTSPIALAKLHHKASERPHIEHPGLGDLIGAYDMIVTLAETPAINDRSPEGIARLKLAALSAGRGAF